MTGIQWVMRTIDAILLELGRMTIPVVMVSMILNRPLRIAGAVTVLTYEKLKDIMVLSQRRKFRADGQALGEAIGEARGQALGEARANKAWTEWFERQQAAMRNNQPFDEPPPTFNTDVHPQ